jgi:hypothetical protein
MVIAKAKQSHIWERDQHDWYVEPHECSFTLFELEKFTGPVWDPACGLGRIVSSAQKLGLSSFGSDIVNRGEHCVEERNFFESAPPYDFSNIVSNPPFGVAEEFVQRAIDLVPMNGKVAMLLPLVWLSGFSTKRSWLPDSPLYRFYPISPRPSMPPGKVVITGEKVGNGTKDFAWFVWMKGYEGSAEVRFMNTKRNRNKLIDQQFDLLS